MSRLSNTQPRPPRTRDLVIVTLDILACQDDSLDSLINRNRANGWKGATACRNGIASARTWTSTQKCRIVPITPVSPNDRSFWAIAPAHVLMLVDAATCTSPGRISSREAPLPVAGASSGALGAARGARSTRGARVELDAAAAAGAPGATGAPGALDRGAITRDFGGFGRSITTRATQGDRTCDSR